ncbi:MAG: hypothetical protein AMXMBFR22_22550 [Phycisphaerae bacterium]
MLGPRSASLLFFMMIVPPTILSGRRLGFERALLHPIRYVIGGFKRARFHRLVVTNLAASFRSGCASLVRRDVRPPILTRRRVRATRIADRLILATPSSEATPSRLAALPCNLGFRLPVAARRPRRRCNWLGRRA